MNKNFLLENFKDRKLLFAYRNFALDLKCKQLGLDNFKPVVIPCGGTSKDIFLVITD